MTKEEGGHIGNVAHFSEILILLPPPKFPRPFNIDFTCFSKHSEEGPTCHSCETPGPSNARAPSPPPSSLFRHWRSSQIIYLFILLLHLKNVKLDYAPSFI